MLHCTIEAFTDGKGGASRRVYYYIKRWKRRLEQSNHRCGDDPNLLAMAAAERQFASLSGPCGRESGRRKVTYLVPWKGFRRRTTRTVQSRAGGRKQTSVHAREAVIGRRGPVAARLGVDGASAMPSHPGQRPRPTARCGTLFDQESQDSESQWSAVPAVSCTVRVT